MVRLTDDNFLLYAAQHYDAARIASEEEFYEDLKRFQYLKRLMRRYRDDGDLRLRLILNHFIVLYNCFGPAATNMLFMRLADFHSEVKPFVVFLSFMPEKIEYGERVIMSDDIAMDQRIIEELRKL